MTEATTIPTTESITTEKDGKPFYVTRDLYQVEGGQKENLWIEVAPINPMLLRMAMSAVKLPVRPTYEARTSGGRVELHPLDEVAAAENARDQAKWEMYTEERSEAQGARTDASMRATFFYGTKFTPPNTGWDVEQEMLGIPVPTQPELRKAHYLMSVLTLPDMNGLMRAITRGMGVSEEAISQAEGSF